MSICVVCSQAVSGQRKSSAADWLEFHGRVLHQKCFACAHCSQPLSATTAPPPQERDSRFYHEHCLYEVQAKQMGCVCDGCGKPVSPFQPGVIIIGNRYFHPTCFKCAQCGESLSQGNFFKWGGSAYHEECLDRYRSQLKIVVAPEEAQDSRRTSGDFYEARLRFDI